MKEEASRIGAGYGGGGAAPEGHTPSLLLILFRSSSPNLRCSKGTPCWPEVVATWFLIAASKGDAAW